MHKVISINLNGNAYQLDESGYQVLSEYLARAAEGFTVLAGSGATYFSSLMLGAHGAILAVAGIAPDLCVQIFTCVREGRIESRSLVTNRAIIETVEHHAHLRLRPL